MVSGTVFHGWNRLFGARKRWANGLAYRRDTQLSEEYGVKVRGMVSPVVLLACLSGAIVLVALLIAPLVSFRVEVGKAQAVRDRMLSQMNHQSLLDACRDLSLRASQAGVRRGSIYRVQEWRQAGLPNLPEIIEKLNPASIEVDRPDMILVALSDNHSHRFGVAMYPTDRVGPYFYEVEIIPGLWYFDDDYRDDDVQYRKKIDALIAKGRSRQATGGK
jgi:hypothetical protein